MVEADCPEIRHFASHVTNKTAFALYVGLWGDEEGQYSKRLRAIYIEQINKKTLFRALFIDI
ncbi:hypothetical protein FIU95_21670 (plasmid) [Microbulbifer sp. THAF38]|nr:hypothetical protein FIU95_21670 [Microbulbifer sp. THAF38]